MDAENEKEVGGHLYSFGKLDAMKQFHVARRLGTKVVLYSDISDTADPVTLVMPLLVVMSNLPDADAEFITKTCLSVVRRQDGQGWARVLAGDGSLMYQDLDFHRMLELVGHVIEVNLGSFFAILRQSSSGLSAKGQPSNGSGTKTA